jgi:hypothetical protein
VSGAHICTAFVLAIAPFSAGISTSVASEYCPSGATEIATDRPDVTNSSMVVPQGTLQIESGVNSTARSGNSVIDGPTSRVRLGVTPCTELLLDFSDYFYPVRGRGASGFSDLSLAIKHQLAPLPGEFELSVTAGLEFPTGAVRISGSGYGGYVQLPWSREIGDGWSVSGMFTAFWFPGQRRSNPTLEPTFVVERRVGPRADMFIEYFADGPKHGISSQAIDSGGAYRLTPTQQVDFHAGFGLNRESPDFFFGVGYSFRLDGLF